MISLLYIQSLGVTIEAPPQVNIKLDFPCGCEAPTQSHKAHHQTNEAPTQIQGGFIQIKNTFIKVIILVHLCIGINTSF
jgi:hypothetical protein